MANIAGIVKQATGLVLAVDALGNERILRSGDSVLEGETVKTVGLSSKAEILSEDGKTFEVVSKVDEKSIAPDVADLSQLSQEQQALLSGQNIQNIIGLGDTAAGSATNSGSGGDGVSLSAAGFAEGGHESNIYENGRNLSSNASAIDNFDWPVGVRGGSSDTDNEPATKRVIPTPNIEFKEDKDHNNKITRDEENNGGNKGKTTPIITIPPEVQDGDKLIITGNNGKEKTYIIHKDPSGKTTITDPDDPTNPLQPNSDGKFELPPIPLDPSNPSRMSVKIVDGGDPTNQSIEVPKTVESDPIPTPEVIDNNVTREGNNNDNGGDKDQNKSDIKIKIPDNVVTGDKLIVTVGDNDTRTYKITKGNDGKITVTDENDKVISNVDPDGKTIVTVPNIPVDPTKVDNQTPVTAKIQDSGGKEGNSHSGKVHVDTIPAPEVVSQLVTRTQNDNDNDNDNNQNKASVGIKIPTNVVTGDKLVVTIDNESKPREYTITKDSDGKITLTNGSEVITGIVDKDGKIVATIPNVTVYPKDPDHKTSIEAKIEDVSGNNSKTSKGEISTEATPTPNVEFIEDKNNNGTIAANETNLENKKTTTVAVTIPQNVVDGDKIVMTVNNPDGTKSEYTYTLRVENGKVVSAEAKLPDGTTKTITDIKEADGKTTFDQDDIKVSKDKSTTVSVKLVDESGNESESRSDEAIIQPPKTPIVDFIEDKNGDHILDRSETKVLGDDDKTNDKTKATVTLPDEMKDGETIKITIKDPINGEVEATYKKQGDNLVRESNATGGDYLTENLDIGNGNVVTINSIPIANNYKNTIKATLIDDQGVKTDSNIDEITPDIVKITNMGLDAEIYTYKYTESYTENGKSQQYGVLNDKNLALDRAEKWISNHEVSATFTAAKLDTKTQSYSHMEKTTNAEKETPYAEYAKGLGGGITNPNAIAEFAGVKLENVNKDASTFNYKKLSDPNNYTLNEAAPKGTDVVVKYSGYIYVEKDGSYDFKADLGGDYRGYAGLRMKIDNKDIVSSNPDKNDTRIVTEDGGTELSEGFHKVEIIYTETTSALGLKLSIKDHGVSDDKAYKIVGDEDSGARFFSDSFVEALAQNGRVATEDNGTTYISYGKEGFTKEDYNDVVEFSRTAKNVSGSNADDTFVYNEDQTIDGKGGVDTLIIGADGHSVDLTKVTDLDSKIHSFERIQLGASDKESITLTMNAENVRSIVDSHETSDKMSVNANTGTKSLNTILKVDGDGNDVLNLKGFKEITSDTDKINMLNNKHDAMTGDEYNKVDTKHYKVYESNDGQGATVYIQVDNDIKVDL